MTYTMTMDGPEPDKKSKSRSGRPPKLVRPLFAENDPAKRVLNPCSVVERGLTRESRINALIKYTKSKISYPGPPPKITGKYNFIPKLEEHWSSEQRIETVEKAQAALLKKRKEIKDNLTNYYEKKRKMEKQKNNN